MENVYVQGMHGLGDNLHQRAFIKELAKVKEVYLETSWPQIYWDIPNIRFVAKGTRLRTQLKNQYGNIRQYQSGPTHPDSIMRVSYKPEHVRETGSVLDAMMKSVGCKGDDFSFKPKQEWVDRAKELVKSNTSNKPVLIYRPLVIRKEWGGCDIRNPSVQTYKTLFDQLQKDFFVISIADLRDKIEWQVSLPITPDLEFHKGELSFEDIAGLFGLASMVFCSPGFATVLARSMGVPVITVFGGYENGSSFSKGYGPYLPIDTVEPCSCFSHRHKCNKVINIDEATVKIKDFCHAHIASSQH